VQLLRDDRRYVIRLDRGEEIFQSLEEWARREQVTAGIVVEGIGALSKARIGFWNGSEYSPRSLTTPHELLSLHGSLALSDGAPSWHLHATLAAPDHGAVGGHLLEGEVGVIVELLFEKFPSGSFERPLDEALGLRRLELRPLPGGPA
jgi:predicted DNA-binding protein with PD1-like motif